MPKQNRYIACNLQLVEGDEIKLAVVGAWGGHTNGAFALSLDDLHQIKTNFDNSKVDAVIDLDHATVFKGTGEAYGWIKQIDLKGDELWGKIDWLEDGKELVKSKKYKYISPVFLPNTIDQITANNVGWSLHSAALTNRPFLEELGEIKANNNSENNSKEKTMTPEEQKKMDDLEQKVKELEAKLKEKDEELEKNLEKSVENEVDSAIALNKVNKEQKDTLIALGKTNPNELKKLLDSMRAASTPPNDMFANSNNGSGQNQNQIDVLKLGGITNG